MKLVPFGYYDPLCSSSSTYLPPFPSPVFHREFYLPHCSSPIFSLSHSTGQRIVEDIFLSSGVSRSIAFLPRSGNPSSIPFGNNSSSRKVYKSILVFPFSSNNSSLRRPPFCSTAFSTSAFPRFLSYSLSEIFITILPPRAFIFYSFIHLISYSYIPSIIPLFPY